MMETLHAPHGASERIYTYLAAVIAMRFIASERRRVFRHGQRIGHPLSNFMGIEENQK
jgi:hypothetical protein